MLLIAGIRNFFALRAPAGRARNSNRLLQFRPLRGEKNTVQADAALAQRHFRWGWWSIAVFGLAGLVLETLHGFKVGAYLDASNETRRLLWTLAHAHGTLLGLVHIGLAATVRSGSADPVKLGTASTALVGASVLLPGGFFLGGIQFYAGDPGVGVALVPVGAALLIYAAVVVAKGVRS